MNEVVISTDLELPHELDVPQQEVRLWTRQAHPLEVLQWLIDEAEGGRESITLHALQLQPQCNALAPQTLPHTLPQTVPLLQTTILLA